MIAVWIVASSLSPLRAPLQVGMSDGVGTDDVAWALGAVILVGGAVGVLLKAMSPIFRMARQWGDLVDALIGTEARPGIEATPGLFARVKSIEEIVARLTTDKDTRS